MGQISGHLSKFLYRNERNYYATFLLNTGREIATVVGHFPIAYMSLRMTVHGSWKSHKKYGKQFQATSYKVMAPTTKAELVDFLCSDFVGAPLQLVHLISNKMGLSYLNHYKNVQFCLKALHVTGKNSEVGQELLSMSRKVQGFYCKLELLETLVSMGFKQDISCKIAFSEKPPNVDDVINNPYQLIKPFELEWKIVDTIALKNGISKSSKVRIQEALFYLVDESAVQKGHMFLPESELATLAKAFIGTTFLLKEELTELEASGRIIRDYNDHIYSPENHQSERLLSDNLYRIFHSAPSIHPIAIDFSETNFPFSTEQKEAIQMTIDQQISLISGPAGTGKTTVIREIIKWLVRAGHNIRCCAPTGAAAKQMLDLTGMKSSTIQHLLSFSPLTKTPAYHRDFTLDGSCFIVDESSMADVKVLSFLVDAIPQGAKLIIIGDHHQLPSIGPGRVLKDLLSCGLFPGKELTNVYRQSEESQVLDFATKIRNGERTDLSLLPQKSDFKFYSQNDLFIIRQNIEQLILRFIASGKYDVYDDLQIVTPIHAGPLGTKELNSMLQNLINPTGNEVAIGDKLFREGDKVIQIRNNYDKKVYNGETGRIEHIPKRGKHIVVNFNGNSLVYLDDELFELELAYAQTVHKVQGREIPFVIAPFHLSFGDRMLNRKLLYTLLTRSKQQFIMLGQEQAFYQAAIKDDTDVRHCNLIARLKSARLAHLFK